MLFPTQLHCLLERASDDPKMSKIISWMPSGRAFKIHDPEEFEKVIMPQHFRCMNSFRSFRRQLNFYGMKKIFKRDLVAVDKNGIIENFSPNTPPRSKERRARLALIGAYYNPLFRRDRSDLATTMIRPFKGSKTDASCPRNKITERRSSTPKERLTIRDKDGYSCNSHESTKGMEPNSMNSIRATQHFCREQLSSSVASLDVGDALPYKKLYDSRVVPTRTKNLTLCEKVIVLIESPSFFDSHNLDKVDQDDIHTEIVKTFVLVHNHT